MILGKIENRAAVNQVIIGLMARGVSRFESELEIARALQNGVPLTKVLANYEAREARHSEEWKPWPKPIT
jgi:hypothetical protein